MSSNGSNLLRLYWRCNKTLQQQYRHFALSVKPVLIWIQFVTLTSRGQTEAAVPLNPNTVNCSCLLSLHPVTLLCPRGADSLKKY